LLRTILLTACDRRRQLRSSAANMAASECWARSAATLLWLEECLQSPQISHDAELILPQGGLTRGHLFELTRMAVDSSVYDAFDGVCSRDAGVALHIWLYHLQGGEASQLPLPTASRTPLSSKLRRDAKKALEEHELALKSSNKSIDNKRRRSAQGGASLESLEANLATLRAAPYEQPFRWNGLQPTSAAPARTASGGGGGGGGAPPPGAAERERRLGCKLSLALGTHRRVGQDCPFRTFADEGGRDVLRFIAELGLTDDSGVGNPHAEPNVPGYNVDRLDRLMIRMIASELAGEGAEIAQTSFTPTSRVTYESYPAWTPPNIMQVLDSWAFRIVATALLVGLLYRLSSPSKHPVRS